MKAAIYHGIENVSVEEIPMPECGDNDVILKNVRGSICGTDIGAYYHGGDDAGIFPGHTFGHEMSAVVYKKRKNVSDDIEIGMRVFPNPTLSKRADSGLSMLEICDECGAFSQYVQIQDAQLDYNLFELPENVSFDEAAIIEPFSVAMHGINQVNVKEFLRDLFGKDVSNLGGSPACDVDVYIDTSGAPVILPTILDCAKPHARVSIVALYHRNVSLNPYLISCAEIEIKGSFAYTNDDIREVIYVLKNKTTPVAGIITHHYPLDQIKEAFTMAANQNESLKILIDHEA